MASMLSVLPSKDFERPTDLKSNVSTSGDSKEN